MGCKQCTSEVKTKTQANYSLRSDAKISSGLSAFWMWGTLGASMISSFTKLRGSTLYRTISMVRTQQKYLVFKMVCWWTGDNTTARGVKASGYLTWYRSWKHSRRTNWFSCSGSVVLLIYRCTSHQARKSKFSRLRTLTSRGSLWSSTSQWTSMLNCSVRHSIDFPLNDWC